VRCTSSFVNNIFHSTTLLMNIYNYMCIHEPETGPGAHPDSCTMATGGKVAGALR
jgi:hypothetical protein